MKPHKGWFSIVQFCPDPNRLEYEELVATIQGLQARIVELEAELAKARKNLETSSKPPSSDTVKPKPKNTRRGRPKKRKRGGLPGIMLV